jgi:molybdopterin converting factor subunit 1
MIYIKVLFFATLKEKAGTRQVEFDIPEGATIAQLKDLIVEKYPGLKDMLNHCLASINHDYRSDESEIPAHAEVALFPPVSGG